MPIKKLDFKFINEIHRNDHIKEIMEVVNNNADIENTMNTDLYGGFSGTNASTKKIYYHPIIIQSAFSDTSTAFVFSIAILNNDPTPFTFTTFIEWAENLSNSLQTDVTINTSGFYATSGIEVTSVSYLLLATDKSWRIRGGRTGVLGVTNTTLTKAQFSALPIMLFQDNVNAIN